MLDYQTLLPTIRSLPTSQLEGYAYRVVKLKYLERKVGDNNVLDAAGAMEAIGSRITGGRYNPPLVFEALYLADNSVHALLEVGALKKTDDGLAAVKGSPITLLSLEYKLNSVLDLVDGAVQAAIGTNSDELKEQDWFGVNQQKHQITATQQLGLVVYILHGIEALKVPSAKVDGAYNLVVFPDRLSGDSFVQIYDPDGKINARIP